MSNPISFKYDFNMILKYAAASFAWRSVLWELTMSVKGRRLQALYKPGRPQQVWGTERKARERAA